jgi:hypothetical protein
MKTQEIVFTLQFGDEAIPEQYYPIPAEKNIPAWYKNMITYYDKSNAKEKRESQTIKRCMPVFDAFTAGYLIVTHTAINISYDENKGLHIDWANDTLDAVTFHGAHQLVGYRGLDLPTGAPKLRNPWGIKTPKGYSCYFMPPAHREKTGIRILEGYVDTDTYNNSVQFPFLIDEGFEGEIPAGTPIAQVIPFKRDSFKMRIGGVEERVKTNLDYRFVRSQWINNYRNHFRQDKNYK